MNILVYILFVAISILISYTLGQTASRDLICDPRNRNNIEIVKVYLIIGSNCHCMYPSLGN